MLFCEVCLVEFNSQIPFQEHLVSNNHLNATRFQEAIKSKKFETPFYCSICCLYTNSQPILEIHFNSEKHKTKQRVQEKLGFDCNLPMRKSFSVLEKMSSRTVKDQLVTNLDPNKDFYELDTINWQSNWCHCCYCEFTGRTHKESHLNGKEHKKKIKIKQQYDNGIDIKCCCYCWQLPINQDQLNIHYKSNNHLDQIKRYDNYYEANKNSLNVTVINRSINSSTTSSSLTSLNSDYSSSELSSENLKSLTSESLNDSLFSYLCKYTQSESTLNNEVENKNDNNISNHNSFNYSIPNEPNCTNVNYSKFKDDLNLVLSIYEDGNSFENILNAFQACHIQLKLETDLEFIY